VYFNYHQTGQFTMQMRSNSLIADMYPVLLGLGYTTMEKMGAEEQKSWISPPVRARGKLAYSKGRMRRAFGDKEWEAFRFTLGVKD
jgi:hypothetical protein